MVRTQYASYSDTGEPDRIYRRSEMRALTGYSVPHLYELINKGEFPKPIKLGQRASGWLASEIHRWQQQRIRERDGEAA
jgi:prophage regulatory protein